MNNIKEIINNTKIQTKLIGIYLIVILLTVAVIGAYFTNRITNVVVDKAVYDETVNSNIIEYRVQEIFELAINLSDMIYGDERLNKIISADYDNYNDVIEAYKQYPMLENYLKYYSEISSIRLYVDNEDILSGGCIFKVNDNIREENWYKNALSDSGVITWSNDKDYITKQTTLSLIRCIKDTSGKKTGVLVININKNIMLKILNDVPYTSAIALDNKVVYCNNSELKDEIDKNNISTLDYSEERVEINGEDNEFITRGFNVSKSFKNNFQIIITSPISSITNQTNIVIKKSVFLIILVTLVSMVLIIFFSKIISKRISFLSSEMHKVVQGNFDIDRNFQGKDEIGQLYGDLITMMDSIKKLIQEVYIEKIQKEQLKIKQSEIEFKMLANQINPHFLFNTLETIRMKAFCNGDREVANIVKKLGKIMRRNIEVSDEIVSLKSEVDLVEYYLEIQGLRFEGKVSYEINTDLNINTYFILPLILQPIVENAFIHGVEASKEKGKIVINIYIKDDYLIIEVKDNGVGIDREKLDYLNGKSKLKEQKTRKRIGVRNVRERIKIYYGDKYGVYIYSKVGEGTLVKLMLPIVKEEGE